MNRLEELLLLWEDNTLSPQDTDELTEQMQRPEARRQAVEFFLDAATLADAFQEEASASPSLRRPTEHVLRKPSRSMIYHLIPLAAAAAAAVMIGIWWMGAWEGARGKPASLQLRRPRGQVMARVEAASGQWTLLRQGYGGQAVDSGQYGRKRALNVGDEVRVGDRITVGKGGRVRLAYVGEETSVELGERSLLSIQPSFAKAMEGKHPTSNAHVSSIARRATEERPTPKLERGTLTAEVAKQSAIRNPKSAIRRRFAILTPHAVVLVKGTRFMIDVDETSSRLEVAEGLVGFTSLSDEQSVDVAAGQWARASSGIPLVVKAVAEAMKRPPEAVTHDMPEPSGYTLGPIVFEDNFDKGLDNWELLVGKDLRSLEPAGDEAKDILALKRVAARPAFKEVFEGHRDHGAAIISFKRDRAEGRIVCLRSKSPITEEAFSVKCFFLDVGAGGSYTTPFPWAAILKEKVIRRRRILPSHYVARWDYVPAGRGEDDAPLLETRFYLKDMKYLDTKNQGLMSTRIIACVDRRIGIAFSSGQMSVLRVEVRRMMKK